MPDTSFLTLAQRFDAPGVRAIALVGSHARGDAGPASDVDLLRLVDADAAPPGSGSHLIDGQLVVVGDAAPDEVERWFTAPEVAAGTVAGLRWGRALIDRDGAWAAVAARAAAFRWDAAMQQRADAWCSAQLVGLIEETHKGLEGLRRADTGRLLNARFGLSWLLARVLTVHHGVLVSGDNGFWAELAVAAPESAWVRLRERAFGVDGSSLAAQVRAGLQLYIAVAEQLAPRLQPEHAPLVEETVALLRATLNGAPGANIAGFT